MPLKLIKLKTSPNWYVRGTVRRQSVFETTGTADAGEAEVYRVNKEKELVDRALYGKRPTRTFAEAALAYMESPGSSEKERRFVFPLVDAFGTTMLPDITQERVDRYIATQYRDRAPATVLRNVITPLSAVLNFAARRKWCEPPKFDRPKQPKGRRRWATFEEAQAIVNKASPHIQKLVLFLLYTGARMSEALDLDWADVDLEKGWVVFRDTKNDEDRGVPLHPEIVKLLGTKGVGRVFTTQHRSAYVDKDRTAGGQIKTAWRLTLARARVKDIRPHDLRHTFSTWLTMAGVHEQVRDELMGHASTDMGRRYSHVPRKPLIQAVAKLPKLTVTRKESVKAKILRPIYVVVIGGSE